MNGVVTCVPPGAYLGNATMSYLHARAHAERVGAELQMDEWIGEKVFNVPVNRITEENRDLPLRSEMDLKPDETNVCIRGYAQRQEAMIYTKAQAKGWLRFRWTLTEIFGHNGRPADWFLAHHRLGDIADPGSLWPIVSRQSYARAMFKNFGFSKDLVGFVSQEEPTPHLLGPELHFIGDFWRLCHCQVLFRGNSSFSWLAGLIGDAMEVFSPRIDGLAGGIEHFAEFERGNHCKLGNFDLCSDLHVKE